MALTEQKISIAIAVLEDAVNHCVTDDLCTKEVLSALDFLATEAAVKWPFDQFRKNLLDQTKRESEFEKEARRQVLRASLNGIRRVLRAK